MSTFEQFNNDDGKLCKFIKQVDSSFYYVGKLPGEGIPIPFDSEWVATDDGNGNFPLTICFKRSDTFDITIDWDDGITESYDIYPEPTGCVSHNYAASGIYNVKVVGYYFIDPKKTDMSKLLKINDAGSLTWTVEDDLWNNSPNLIGVESEVDETIYSTTFAIINTDKDEIEEGKKGSDSVTFVVDLVDAMGKPITIPESADIDITLNWSGDGKTEGNISPYILPTKISFVGGDNVIFVKTIDDIIPEDTKTLSVEITEFIENNDLFEISSIGKIENGYIEDAHLKTITILDTDKLPFNPILALPLDPILVDIKIDDMQVNAVESDDIISFDVSIDNVALDNVNFIYKIVGESATVGEDFVGTSGAGIIPAGYTTTSINVKIKDDYLIENPENFFVSLVSAEGASELTIVTILEEQNQGEGIIYNEDDVNTPFGVIPFESPDTVYVHIDGVSATIGNLDGSDKTVNYTVRLVDYKGRTVTIPTSTDGTNSVSATINFMDVNFADNLQPVNIAVGGADYDNTTQVVEITEGNSTAEFGVNILGDIVDEEWEVFTVKLDSVSQTNNVFEKIIIIDSSDPTLPTRLQDFNGYIETTIYDESTPLFNITGFEVHEFDGMAYFTVDVNQEVDEVFTVNYTIRDGSATDNNNGDDIKNNYAGDDFDVSEFTGTFTFNPGEALSQDIAIQIKDDDIYEGKEYLIATLSNPSTGSFIENRNAYGFIYDENMNTKSGIPAPGFGQDETYWVTISGPSEIKENVGYAHYVLKLLDSMGNVVTTMDDHTVNVYIGFGTGTARGGYNYDDAFGADFNDYYLSGSTGGMTIEFDDNKPAIKGFDVAVFNDIYVEDDETITVKINGVGQVGGVGNQFEQVIVVDNNAPINVGDASDSFVTTTILANDTLPILSVSGFSVLEGTGRVEFPVRLTRGAISKVTVKYTLSDDSATSRGDNSGDVDWTPIGSYTGTLTFPFVDNPTYSEELERKVLVKIPADYKYLSEGFERFKITLSDPVGAIISNPVAYGIIRDRLKPVPPVVTPPKTGLPYITSPIPDSTFKATSANFKWDGNNSDVSTYALEVGIDGVGSNNIISENTGTGTELIVNNLPNNGNTVYVRLNYNIDNVWSYTDYTCIAYNPPGEPPFIASEEHEYISLDGLASHTEGENYNLTVNEEYGLIFVVKQGFEPNQYIIQRLSFNLADEITFDHELVTTNPDFKLNGIHFSSDGKKAIVSTTDLRKIYSYKDFSDFNLEFMTYDFTNYSSTIDLSIHIPNIDTTKVTSTEVDKAGVNLYVQTDDSVIHQFKMTDDFNLNTISYYGSYTPIDLVVFGKVGKYFSFSISENGKTLVLHNSDPEIGDALYMFTLLRTGDVTTATYEYNKISLGLEEQSTGIEISTKRLFQANLNSIKIYDMEYNNIPFKDAILKYNYSFPKANFTLDPIITGLFVNETIKYDSVIIGGVARAGYISSGDEISFKMNGNAYTTYVTDNGTWSTDVKGEDICSQDTVEFAVKSPNANGVVGEYIIQNTYTIENSDDGVLVVDNIDDDNNIDPDTNETTMKISGSFGDFEGYYRICATINGNYYETEFASSTWEFTVSSYDLINDPTFTIIALGNSGNSPIVKTQDIELTIFTNRPMVIEIDTTKTDVTHNSVEGHLSDMSEIVKRKSFKLMVDKTVFHNGLEIVWGDGTKTEFTGITNDGSLVKTYSTSGVYKIYIFGKSSIRFDESTYNKIINVVYDEGFAWQKMDSVFSFDSDPTVFFNEHFSNNINTSEVTSMISTFENCTTLTNQDMSNWNTRLLRKADRIFKNASNFNSYLRSWDVNLVNSKLDAALNCPIEIKNNPFFDLDIVINTSVTDDNKLYLNEIPGALLNGTITGSHAGYVDSVLMRLYFDNDYHRTVYNEPDKKFITIDVDGSGNWTYDFDPDYYAKDTKIEIGFTATIEDKTFSSIDEYKIHEHEYINEYSSATEYLAKFDLNNDYNNVRWVDPENGDNTNDGTQENPFKTFTKAYGLTSSGDAIILWDGTYNVNLGADSYNNGGFLVNSGVHVIAARPGKVIFKNTPGSKRDNPMFVGGYTGNRAKLFGLVFSHNYKGGHSFQKPVFRAASYELVNCVYAPDYNAYNLAPSMTYDNDNLNRSILRNCTFTTYHRRYGTQHGWDPKYSGNYPYAYASAFVNSTSHGAHIYSGTRTFGNATFDKTFTDFDFSDDIDINANVGVYTGTYAWPKKPSE